MPKSNTGHAALPELQFEYCECGCKHSNASFGQQRFSSQYHTGSGKFSLYHGLCGRGAYIGMYVTRHQRDAKVRELALPKVEEELASLTKQHQALAGAGE